MLQHDQLSDIMVSVLPFKLAVAVLLFVACTSRAQDTSSNSSLRVKDYDAEGKLPNGTSMPLYTLTWRAVGSAFSANNFQLNATFTSHANTAFEQAPHKMVYTAVNVRDAAAFQTSRSLDGNTGRHSSGTSIVAHLSLDHRC